MSRCLVTAATALLCLGLLSCDGGLLSSGSGQPGGTARDGGQSPGDATARPHPRADGSTSPSEVDAGALDLGSVPPDGDAGPPRPNRPLAPCDFDGDGLSDLALFEPGAGMWHVTASSSGRADANNWGWDAVDPVPAEYDGDGRVDRAVYYAPEGQWFINSSVGGWVGDEPVTVGPPGAFPAPADYDGDGLAELAVYEPRSTTWYERDFGDRQATPRQTPFGLPSSVPIPADFDGDGAADRAVYQRGTHRWLVRRSSDAQTLDFELGHPHGRVIAADYDGDGLADAASFDRKTGVWALRTTATGQSPAWAPISFAGAAGGLPVLLDVDGDQIADPAVALVEGQTLLVRLSTSGAIETHPLPAAGGRPACPTPLAYRGGRHITVVAAATTIRNDPTARALAITFDRLEQPHVMTDRNRNPGLNLYSRIGGRWQAIEPVIQKEDHGPMYPTPHIDAEDRLWFSSGVFRANDTDATSAWVGMMSNVTVSPALQWEHKIEDWITFGGRLAIDPHSPGQAWHVTSWIPYQIRRYDVSGFAGRDGTIELSRGTRTIDFQIAAVDGGRSEGIWHVAHAVSYENPAAGKSIRPGYWNSTMGAYVTWNQRVRSDGIDSDSTNASLGLDETDPQVAFMSAYTDALKMNIWDGARLVYGDTPEVVDPATASLGNAVAYFSPQWSHAANGGAFLCWTDAERRIRLQHFAVDGQRTPAVAAVIGPGTQCDLTTDFRGDLHLVYVNGGLQYQVVHTRGR